MSAPCMIPDPASSLLPVKSCTQAHPDFLHPPVERVLIPCPVAVSAEDKVEYTRIIDGILATADLNTVSRKKVRDGLETALDRDLSAQKASLSTEGRIGTCREIHVRAQVLG